MLSVGPVLSRLRVVTAHLHQTLEDRLDAIERLSSQSDRRALVSRYYRMHASADLALEAWLGEAADLDPAARRRTPLLVKDMAALGLTTPPVSGLPRIALESLAEALGFLYVLEGSALGGRVIRKGLQAKGKTLRGLSFLDPYGDETAGRWRSFLGILEREGAGDPDGVMRGGLAGFEHASSCLLAPQPAAA